MFDVGFWEMAMVGVVALLVIGPKDLPRVARIAGMWVGRARRTLASVKGEIDRELKAQELKDILEKQARSNPLETLVEASRPATISKDKTEPDSTARPPAGGGEGAG